MKGEPGTADRTDPVTVLLIDDEPRMLEFTRDMLDGMRPGGYRVTWASHYEEGLEALLSDGQDVCLLDHNLGDRTGLELLREAVGRGASTPVVMITGHKDPETDLEAMEAGAADYLVKGEITPTLLERALRYTLNQSRAAATLRESEESYRALFRSVREAIYIQAPDGRFLDVNDAAAEAYGYTRAEIVGGTPDMLAAEGQVDLDQTAGYMAAALAGNPQRFEWWGRRKNGEVFPKEVSLTRGTYFGQEVVIAVARDVSERQALEEQLRQSQKIEAVGRLAGGIAHDFNNLLTGILGHTDFVLQDLPPDSPHRPDLEEVRRNGERARDLTSQLLAFSRKQVLQPRVLDMDEAVRGVEKLLRRVTREDVEIETEVMTSDLRVEADPGQLDQLIVNLGVNGSDAMPDGGRITLRVGATRISPDEAAAYPYSIQPGPYVTLEVIDTGVGMSAEVKEHIFEPFFTTKQPGKGTGLGLAMVYGIVKQSGGFIEVESSPGEGSRFMIHFPRVDEDVAPAVPPANGAVRSGRGGETVLLVEDERAVRILARRILMKSGYTVLEAGSPAEALDEVVPRHGGTIDLLITDVVMPGMGGHELADQVRALRPGISVIYMSGYTEDDIARQGIGHAGRRFLAKPFTPAEFEERVREVLDDAH